MEENCVVKSVFLSSIYERENWLAKFRKTSFAKFRSPSDNPIYFSEFGKIFHNFIIFREILSLFRFGCIITSSNRQNSF